MFDDYIEVGVDEYDETSPEQPIIYTRDIKTCVVALIHRSSSTVMTHIEITNGQMHEKNFKSIVEELKGEEMSIELFVGPDTEEKYIDELVSIADNCGIDVEIYPSKTDMYGNGSIGYNQSNHLYYDVMMENGRPIFNSYDIRKKL